MSGDPKEYKNTLGVRSENEVKQNPRIGFANVDHALRLRFSAVVTPRFRASALAF